MLPWSWAAEQLVTTRNYWICTVRADGSPHAMPVWGVAVDETVVFGTSPGSRKARNLRRDPRVVVHVDSADDCVIVEGEVEEVAVEPPVAAAYKEKYDLDVGGDDSGLFFRVRRRVVWAWREHDYPQTATRFDFD